MDAVALLLADGRTPTGGYAHSGGLEPAVADGLRMDGVPAFVDARLRTAGLVDATVAVAATTAGCATALLDLDLELAARTPSQAARLAADQLGRGLLRIGVAWWPRRDALREYAAATAGTSRPVAFGAVAAAAGLDPLTVARMSLYEDVATVVAAAPKLLPIDAAEAARWCLEAADRIDDLARDAVAAGRRGALPIVSTPLLDARAELHHDNDRRLFAS